MAATSFLCTSMTLRPLSSIRTMRPDDNYYYNEKTRHMQARSRRIPAVDRIWRHMLYIRTFHFLSGGVLLTVKVEMVRFIYVNSSRTFTFYSSLFLPRTSYAREFIRTAISSPSSEARFFVSAGTLRHWESTCSSFFPAQQDHNCPPRPFLPGMV